MMLGKVTYPGGEAVLNDRGEWESADTDLATHMNSTHAPGSFGGIEVVLPFGRFAVDRAADFLRGKAEHAKPLEPLPPDVVS